MTTRTQRPSSAGAFEGRPVDEEALYLRRRRNEVRPHGANGRSLACQPGLAPSSHAQCVHHLVPDGIETRRGLWLCPCECHALVPAELAPAQLSLWEA